MNFWDIGISILLFLAVTAAVLHLYRRHKTGGFSCFGSCSGCPLACSPTRRKKTG